MAVVFVTMLVLAFVASVVGPIWGLSRRSSPGCRSCGARYGVQEEPFNLVERLSDKKEWTP